MFCNRYFLFVDVVLFVRVEVVDYGQYYHSSLPHHRLSFCTGSGIRFYSWRTPLEILSRIFFTDSPKLRPAASRCVLTMLSRRCLWDVALKLGLNV